MCSRKIVRVYLQKKISAFQFTQRVIVFVCLWVSKYIYLFFALILHFEKIWLSWNLLSRKENRRIISVDKSHFLHSSISMPIFSKWIILSQKKRFGDNTTKNVNTYSLFIFLIKSMWIIDATNFVFFLFRIRMFNRIFCLFDWIENV